MHVASNVCLCVTVHAFTTTICQLRTSNTVAILPNMHFIIAHSSLLLYKMGSA